MRGMDDVNSSNKLNLKKTTSLKVSTKTFGLEYLVPLYKPSKMVSIQERFSIPWLLQQSTVLWTTWNLSSGTSNSKTSTLMILANIHAFYQSNTKAIRTKMNLSSNKKPCPLNHLTTSKVNRKGKSMRRSVYFRIFVVMKACKYLNISCKGEERKIKRLCIRSTWVFHSHIMYFLPWST